MPEVAGHIELDASGLCNLCAKHRDAGAGQSPAAAAGLPELLERVDALRSASTGPYDCLAALSGGKDSTMALHIAVKQLGPEAPCRFYRQWFLH